MDINLKKLFEDNFDFAFNTTIYNNMVVAVRTLNQFLKSNESFFSFDKREHVFGHLRTYAIEKQFFNSAFNPKSNYSVSLKQVNDYKYKALCIETNDFILNIGRTGSANKLLPASRYKKEFAKANSGLDSQLSFDFINGTPEIVECKKYAEIIYGYSQGEMTHLKIVLPSSDYTIIEHSKDLSEDAESYVKYVPKETVEESIVALKDSLSEELKKKTI